MAKFVTIDTFTSPWDAHIAKGVLESEGIPAFVAHENHVWANWVLSQALGGVKIQVAFENASIAKEILNSLHKGRYEEELKNEFPDIKDNVCPKCGNQRFKSRFPVRDIIFVILTLGLFGIIFPPRRENHTCLKCGQKWKY
jgi:hypothetical protein